MRSAILLTAGTRSIRLPRKILREIRGRTVVEHLIDRLKLARRPEAIVMCTSTHPADDVLVELADRNGIGCFRGSEFDLLERYRGATVGRNWDFVVIVDADDLFCDPPHIDQTIGTFEETGADFIKVDGLPFGVAPNGVKVKALEEVCAIKGEDSTDGWGKYFTRSGLFQVLQLPVADARLRRPELRMSLDYPEDLQFFEAVFAALYVPGRVFALEEVIGLLKAKPEIADLNKHMQEAYWKRFKQYESLTLRPGAIRRGNAESGKGNRG